MKVIKKIVIAFATLFLLFAAVVFAGIAYVKNQAAALDSAGSEKFLRLKIESGTTAREIANNLYKNAIIKNADVFYLFARFPRFGEIVFAREGAYADIFTIKKGVCEISSGMNALQIYKALSQGRDVQIQVSIPEGLTITKIAERLETADVCKALDFAAAARDKSLLQSLGLPYESAEGYLFPDTYFFAKQEDSPNAAKDCVRAMVKNFFEKIGAIKNFPNDKDAANSVVILASVIEREYRASDEAPLIASVFANRIKNHIGLYSCATVEYVITEILGRPHPDIITFDDLEIDSPYNTYMYEGLPPAPISNPGIVALNAAANPAKSDYFYFRLIDEEEGRHVFTKTLEEHERQTMIFKTKKLSK